MKFLELIWAFLKGIGYGLVIISVLIGLSRMLAKW